MINRHLHDTFDFVLNGVFGGEDFDVLGVHLAQGGVQGGRLTGTGRTGNDEDTVRTAYHRTNPFLDVFLHRQGVEAQVDDGLVQDTQHDGLTELGREGGHT